jgi:hypothetical protein
MNNDTLFAKSKKDLDGALRLIEGKNAETIDAISLENAATLALVAVRNMLRLAGRIDVPRPQTILVKPAKRKKPVAPPPVKSLADSARRGKSPAVNRDVVFNVSMDLEEGNDMLNSGMPSDRPKVPTRKKRKLPKVKKK